MARPVCERFCVSCHHQSALTYPALEQGSEPRWRSAQPGPHNLTDLLGPLSFTKFQAAVRLLGHSRPPLANIVSPVQFGPWNDQILTPQQANLQKRTSPVCV